MTEHDTPTKAHRYDAAFAQEVEAKWQDRWESLGTFNAENATGALATSEVPPGHQGLREMLRRADILLVDRATRRLADIIHSGHTVDRHASRGSVRLVRAPDPDLVGQHLFVRRSPKPETLDL